jgi:hypothetical protein
MKTLALAAALALGAGTASAELLNFGATDLQDGSGGWGTAFSKTYHLHLDAGSWVSGQLFTKSVFGGQLPTVDVQSTLLRQGQERQQERGFSWFAFGSAATPGGAAVDLMDCTLGIPPKLKYPSAGGSAA